MSIQLLGVQVSHKTAIKETTLELKAMGGVGARARL